MEDILVEWEAFARSFPGMSQRDQAELRDHAEEILRAIALDMSTTQTPAEANKKATGKKENFATSSAAGLHGMHRHASGFDINELVSEYRAVRASVTRLWTRDMLIADKEALDELVRFNEAIDEAIHDSVVIYADTVEKSRQLFLGVLGHDVRTPLGAAKVSAQGLIGANTLSVGQLRAAEIIVRSTGRVERMLTDVLDFALVGLRKGLPVNPIAMDLLVVVQDVAQEIRVLYPDHTVKILFNGDQKGEWDTARMHQLVSNLVENAARHGRAGRPITVSSVGQDTEIVLSVHNEGEPISAELLPRIFEPLVRNAEHAKPESLGLGLYIAQEIVKAHNGSIAVESKTKGGTTFTVCLPRKIANDRGES